ncbi:MAG TPA: hypothetical protein VF573_17385 [Paraburkholderia sp.]|uniref:hypothetical protein n=1 Tax=Paraburkholderia sp. TaxID=1926495 RepID=UPI002ED44C17
MSFGAMPPAWIADRRLTEFSGAVGVLGRSIAALKCHLAIAANHPRYSDGAVLSFFDIATLAKLSRPMVVEGLEMLRAFQLVEIEKKAVKNTNRYVLIGHHPDASFTKVPQDRISDRLRDIGNRGSAHLDALKIYLTLLFLRDNNTNVATVSHERLVHYTGVRPDAVARANSVIAALGMMLIRRSESEWSVSGHPTNEYTLLGDFAGTRPSRLLPSDKRHRLPPWQQ